LPTRAPHGRLTKCGKESAGSGEEICAQRRHVSRVAVNQEWAMGMLTKIARCEKGANAIEYALVASLIAIAAVAAMNNLGTHVDTMLNNVSNHL